MKNLVRSTAASILSLFSLACGTPGGGNDAGTGGACSDTTAAEYKCDGATSVTTSDLWTNVINPKCVSTCHKPGGTAISYGDYSTAAQVQSGSVGVLSLYKGSKGTLKKVDPNNLQNSTFWLKVIGGSTAGKKGPECEAPGNAMPDGQPALSDAEKTQLKNWICTGAQP